MNDVIPNPEDQAAEILEILREEGFNVDPNIAPEDIVDNIDPDKPVSVNLGTVAEAFEGTL